MLLLSAGPLVSNKLTGLLPPLGLAPLMLSRLLPTPWLISPAVTRVSLTQTWVDWRVKKGEGKKGVLAGRSRQRRGRVCWLGERDGPREGSNLSDCWMPVAGKVRMGWCGQGGQEGEKV